MRRDLIGRWLSVAHGTKFRSDLAQITRKLIPAAPDSWCTRYTCTCAVFISGRTHLQEVRCCLQGVRCCLQGVHLHHPCHRHHRHCHRRRRHRHCFQMGEDRQMLEDPPSCWIRRRKVEGWGCLQNSHIGSGPDTSDTMLAEHPLLWHIDRSNLVAFKQTIFSNRSDSCP